MWLSDSEGIFYRDSVKNAVGGRSDPRRTDPPVRSVAFRRGEEESWSPSEMTQKTTPQRRIGFSCAIVIEKRNVLPVFGRSGERSTTLGTRAVCETMSGVGVGQPGSQKEPCRRAYDEALLCSVHSSGVFRIAQTGRIRWAWPVASVDRTSTLRVHREGQSTPNEDPPVRTLLEGEGAID